MDGTETELTAAERRAIAALAGSLHWITRERPLHIDVALAVERAGTRRTWRPMLALRAAVVLAAVLVAGSVWVAWPRAGVGGPSPASTPVASVPGTPGHFDNGEFRFDYPTDWPVIYHGEDPGFVLYYHLVLGNGTWPAGCWNRQAAGKGCDPRTFSVPPGGAFVRVYSRIGGPAVTCEPWIEPNATVGPNAVLETTLGSTTTWEIRVPGSNFDAVNNVTFEVRTDSPVQLARVKSMVESFRWDPGAQLPAAGCTPPPSSASAAPSVAQYVDPYRLGVQFLYPSDWRVLHGYEHFGVHGPTVAFAVGTGTFDFGCSWSGDGGSCAPRPSYTAGAGGVVVFDYTRADPGATATVPAMTLPPDEEVQTVLGWDALFSHGAGWAKWRLAPYRAIEAYWDPANRVALAQVQALVATLEPVPPSTKPDARYSGAVLAFGYPASWHSASFPVVSSFSNDLVYLGTSALSDPCDRTANSVSCSRSPSAKLGANGAFVRWVAAGRPGWTFNPNVGQALTVGGRRATLVDSAATGECAALGGDRQVVVTIERPAPDNWVEMDACLAGPDTSLAMSELETMLDSVVWKG